MSKYNMFTTKQDWKNLYKKVEAEGFDVKPFKKSQSMDSSIYFLDALIRKKLEASK